MHHCLQVPEILDLIFNQLYDDLGSGRSSHVTLLALALTCRTFEDVALNILWCEQFNLVQLIKVLPDRCWKESPHTGFDRDFILCMVPTDDDMTRFCFYARRIRRIKYLPYAKHREESCLRDIRAFRRIWENKRTMLAGPILPKLQSVEYVKSWHATVSLDIFLQTKSISLCLWCGEGDDITKLFPIINQHALNMHDLDLGSFGDSASKRVQCKKLSDLACSMVDLRGLACGSRIVGPPAIRHLASLPYLRKLQLSNTPQEILQSIDSLPQNSGTPFSELEQLTIRTIDLSSLAQLFRRLRPMRLRSITLEHASIPTERALRDIYVALEQSNNSGSLQKIKMKLISGALQRRARGRNELAFEEGVVITELTLEPLLSFTNLIVVKLDISCAFDLGDNAIEAMATHWPRIRRLQLGSLLGWHLPSRVTFSGLLFLLSHCPELEYLAFPFDVSSAIPAINPVPVNKNITYLYVGDSTVDAHCLRGTAHFLRQIFPNVCGIGGIWLYQPDHGFQDHWGSVASIMRSI